MWEENWIVPWKIGVRELDSGDVTGWCPRVSGCLCVQSSGQTESSRSGSLYEHFLKRCVHPWDEKYLLPGLGDQEHPHPHQFQAQLNVLLLVDGSCRFVRCMVAAPLTIHMF